MPGNCVHLSPRLSRVVYWPAIHRNTIRRPFSSGLLSGWFCCLHDSSYPSSLHRPQFPLHAEVSGASSFPLATTPTQVIMGPPQPHSKASPINSSPILVTCSVQLHSRLWVSHGRRLCLYTPHHSALLQLRHLSMGTGTEGLPRLAALKLTWEIRGRSSPLWHLPDELKMSLLSHPPPPLHGSVQKAHLRHSTASKSRSRSVWNLDSNIRLRL